MISRRQILCGQLETDSAAAQQSSSSGKHPTNSNGNTFAKMHPASSVSSSSAGAKSQGASAARRGALAALKGAREPAYRRGHEMADYLMADYGVQDDDDDDIVGGDDMAEGQEDMAHSSFAHHLNHMSSNHRHQHQHQHHHHLAHHLGLEEDDEIIDHHEIINDDDEEASLARVDAEAVEAAYRQRSAGNLQARNKSLGGAHAPSYWPTQMAVEDQAGYQQFDPYSIYTEEDDVWYTEERLFEDHLEEIFNKWGLLDDDIWCKLIIMERNRRIGKAYARVPIVTIDGSHELSYDGYKLALNGFENPDRDAKTEECRKRIGKGVRIKMDKFGNILIKRLSKSAVYIKEWLQMSSPGPSASGSARLGSVPSEVDPGQLGKHHQLMPSRRQLIKSAEASGAGSQSAMGSMLRSNGGSSYQRLQRLHPHHNHYPTMSSSSLNSSNATPPSSTGSSSGAGSSMEPANDSAICDEVISIGGRLDLDKIYVMFDMKKFQANIAQELCRPYPDKRKLEQQCFSIVGLAHDADDILNLPCWFMVINIVAIEMLNERFPSQQPSGASFAAGDTTMHQVAGGVLTSRGQKQPRFVSIFERQNGAPANGASNGSASRHTHAGEEDPYSLPANASTSDVKSSINDYGTTSAGKHNNLSLMEAPRMSRLSAASRYQQAGAYPAPLARRPSESPIYGAKSMATGRLVSRSELNLAQSAPSARSRRLFMGAMGSGADSAKRGLRAGSSSGRLHQASKLEHPFALGGASKPAPSQRGHSNGARPDNNNSIYSPGHMLVLPSGDALPPKLPPRDFVGKRLAPKLAGGAKAGKAGAGADEARHKDRDPAAQEAIYSTGRLAQASQLQQQQQQASEPAEKAARKSRKNRFLESLKAPLELAKSTRSSSVLGASSAGQLQHQPAGEHAKPAGSTGGGGFAKAKNLKSFLGVKSSSSSNKKLASQQPETNSDDSNYVHLAGAAKPPATRAAQQADGGGKGGCEPPAGKGARRSASASACASSDPASLMDLDIPTPDYETDENIYALDERRPASSGAKAAAKRTAAKQMAPNGPVAPVNGPTPMATPNNPAGKVSKGSRAPPTGNNGLQSGGAGNKEDLYYSGYRAHVPDAASLAPSALRAGSAAPAKRVGAAGKPLAEQHQLAAGQLKQQQQQQQPAEDKMSLSAGQPPKSRPTGAERSRFAIHKAMGASGGREAMIYGSTGGLLSGGQYAGSAAAAAQQRSRHQHHQAPGSHYRSASMQRYNYYSQSPGCIRETPHAAQTLAKTRSERLYDADSENPYALSLAGQAAVTSSPYGLLGGVGASMAPSHRRRSGAKLASACDSSPYGYAPGGALHRAGSSMMNGSHYDIGRSSSGIYGNNSSSSSSDYADWHPQMRKVNSSGYLNSIFKSHASGSVAKMVAAGASNAAATQASSNGLAGAPKKTAAAMSSAGNKHSSSSSSSNNNNTSTMSSSANSNGNNNNNDHGYKNGGTYNNNNGVDGTRPLKSTACSSPLSKQQQRDAAAAARVSSSLVNGPTYRSYDSSNDSEPSYTNSSDGLDIYDHIGNHLVSKSNGLIQRNRCHAPAKPGAPMSGPGRHPHAHPHQFLELPPPTEVHVGEWENMYDR